MTGGFLHYLSRFTLLRPLTTLYKPLQFVTAKISFHSNVIKSLLPGQEWGTYVGGEVLFRHRGVRINLIYNTKFLQR